MKTAAVAFGLAVAANAAPSVPFHGGECCSSIGAFGVPGSVSEGFFGKIKQLGDGQLRIGQTNLREDSKFCIDRLTFGLRDGKGFGCLLAGDDEKQFQCDHGKPGEHGWNIGCEGILTFRGHARWSMCPTGDHDGYNVYPNPLPYQEGCIDITLVAEECHASCDTPTPHGPPGSTPPHEPLDPNSPPVAPHNVSTGPDTPNGPHNSTGPNIPIDSHNSTGPNIPTESHNSTGPYTPTEPDTPTEPESEPKSEPESDEPESEEESDEPGSDESESEPESDEPESDEPESEEESDEPETEEESDEPESDEPETPSDEPESDEPETPSDEPGTPTEPESEPDTPTDPDTPAEPESEPDTPTKPETPTGPDTPSSSTTSTDSSTPTGSNTPSKPKCGKPGCVCGHCGSKCPDELTGDWQFPHLIIPVDSDKPDDANGTSFFGTVSKTVTSYFKFDIPDSYADKVCTFKFIFPQVDQMETSSFTLTGSGNVTAGFTRAVTENTTWNNAPKTTTKGNFTLQPGGSYALAKGECEAGGVVGFMIEGSEDTWFKWFQDSNPCPIGLYMIAE